jgi:hypothetical protein
VIDACHAGGDKSVNLESDGDQHKSLSSHELIGGDMAGVVTLASSTKNQLSYFWQDQRMSIFSYWLNEGLKGHADANGDGEITFNELDEYVNKNVSKTAMEIRTPTPQTPVRIIGSDVIGVPVVMTPRAVSLDVLLDDLAEQIAAAMRIYDVKHTGVLEFSLEQGGRALANNGTLAAYCAEQLEERLKFQLPRRDGFVITDRKTVEGALSAKGIGPDSLYDNTISEANIMIGGQPLESYVVGTIESQQGGKVKFRCVLLTVKKRERLHIARGAALLSESEWGMQGRSVVIPLSVPREVAVAPSVNVVRENVTVVNPDNFLPLSPGGTVPVRVAYKPVNAPLVSRIDEAEPQMSHPLNVNNRLFDVAISVRQGSGYVNRPLRFKENEAFVPFRVGDVYQIRLRSTHNEFIAARVLVDGLNTLPQNPLPKNTSLLSKLVAIEEVDKPETHVEVTVESKPAVAPRVSLESARYWLLPPRFNGVIPGFFESVGDKGGTNPAIGYDFRVTTAPQSEAAQKGFTDQIGLITVAYYSTKKAPPPPANETEGQKSGRFRSMRNSGSLGTELGNQFETRLERADYEIDQLLGIVHIHYAEAGFVGGSVSATPTSPSTTAPQQTSPQPQRQPQQQTRPRLLGR